MPPWLWPIVIAAGFVLWFCFLMWAVSHICGWAALARQYRATQPFSDRKHHFRSGKVGWGNYNGCLTLGADAAGLHIAPMFFFRVGHPPLFIPWVDISPKVLHLWLFGEWLELKLERVPRHDRAPTGAARPQTRRGREPRLG